MKIREVSTQNKNVHETLIKLHADCFPLDEMPDFHRGYWWIAYKDDTPIGFCGMTPVKSWSKAAYLARAGVLSKYRGSGLQKRLIRVRIAKAKKIGYEWLISATLENLPSANSLIGCGFKLYQPNMPWLDGNSLYWKKSI